MTVFERVAALNKRIYCVLFSMRCGSTLLCHDLTQWELGAPTESFQTPFYAPRPEGASVADYVVQMVEESPGDVFGFKISWEQTYALTEYLRWEGEDVPGLDLRSVFPGLRYIHMVRRDKVLQAVSLWRAVSTGTWHLRTDSSDRAGTPEYDFETISGYMFQLLAEDWLWTTELAALGIPHMQAIYEEYVERREEALHQVLGFLGETGHPVPLAQELRVLRDDWADGMAARVWADLSAPRHPMWTQPRPPSSIPASF